MAGIFPAGADGGLAPNAGTPNNPTHAYPPLIVPADVAALYYGNGCEVRLRPEVLNSIISEIESTVDRGGVAYQSSDLHNLEKAIRYIVQRGLPEYAYPTGGPSTYTVTLDPPALGYNDGMTLCIVPNVSNIGVVRVNANNRGPVPVYRNDGQELRDGDFQQNRPFLISYYGGAFYVIGNVLSQLPLFQTSDVDGWVRPDGNDANDGTANTPQKAFRTIAGAWNAIGVRYILQGKFAANIRLGIPGTYDGAIISTAGGRVRIIGDEANPSFYIIDSTANFPGYSDFHALAFFSIAAELHGVTLRTIKPPPNYSIGLRCVAGAQVQMTNCIIQQGVNNTGQRLIWMSSGSQLGFYPNNTLLGNNTPSNDCVVLNQSGFGNAGQPGTLTCRDITCSATVSWVDGLSQMSFQNFTISQSNCHGPRYICSNNSIIYAAGQTLPGDANGSLVTGGQYTA